MVHELSCFVSPPVSSRLDGNQRLPESPTEMPDEDSTDRPKFTLPSVRELAKHFTPQEPKHGLQTKSESNHKTCHIAGDSPPQEPELDYSTVPVSEIIVSLQQAAEPPSRNTRRHCIYERAPPATQMEVFRKAESNCKGKQVHSLTARSISREFREGLKKHSYQRVVGRGERGSSGESDQGDVVCNRTKTSPTPSVDLKNMKKFWEEIITANSNSGKQK